MHFMDCLTPKLIKNRFIRVSPYFQVSEINEGILEDAYITQA